MQKYKAERVDVPGTTDPCGRWKGTLYFFSSFLTFNLLFDTLLRVCADPPSPPASTSSQASSSPPHTHPTSLHLCSAHWSLLLQPHSTSGCLNDYSSSFECHISYIVSFIFTRLDPALLPQVVTCPPPPTFFLMAPLTFRSVTVGVSTFTSQYPIPFLAASAALRPPPTVTLSLCSLSDLFITLLKY